ncbi:MAG: dihydroorotase [Halobacteria archaeon]|nr:dihydroorotase [Halobacteria archaeon]
MSLRISNGRVFYDGSLRDVDILVDDGEIAQIDTDVEADDEIDADGGLVLPGAIDVHVHFREPGATHKEDWHTGSRSAAAGGVTTVVDQPNTSPPTVDADAFEQKRRLADEKSVIDFGINAGVTTDWKPNELLDLPVTAFGEIFMADSTGKLGIPRDLFAEAVGIISEDRKLSTIHAEDSSLFVEIDDYDEDNPDAWSVHRPPEAEVSAVEDALGIADGIEDARLHFAHTSHPDSVEAVSSTSHTCEVTPHHLFLSRDDLDQLGTFGRMNPPLRTEEARQTLWDMTDTFDLIASDHAPHTVDEKNAPITQAPSGVPGVETLLPLVLGAVVEDKLSLSRAVELTSTNPAEVFGFDSKGGIEVGNDADLVVTDMETEEIRAEKLHSKAGWTPFESFDAVFPDLVLCRGEVVYDADNGSFGEAGHGELVFPE